MTDDKNGWHAWLAAYLKRFISPGEPHDFIDAHWKSEVMKRDLADMLAAIGDVALDSRVEARFPRQHLRLLLEYADEKAARRRPVFADPLKGEKAPERSSAWNQLMLSHGVIDQKEFKRRERRKEPA